MTASTTPRPPAPPRPAPSQRQAIWALILAIFGGCCLFIPTIWAIVTGFRIINRSEFENVDHGRALGVAAICVGAAHIGATVAWIALIQVSGSDSIYTGQYVGARGNADPSIVQLVELKLRDCFDDSGMSSGEVGVLRTVDCDAPHDAEVIALLPVASDRYPGQEAISKQGADCRTSFTDYVGVPLRRSGLAATYYYPTRASWAADPRSHAITCIATDPPGKLHDSVWRSER